VKSAINSICAGFVDGRYPYKWTCCYCYQNENQNNRFLVDKHALPIRTIAYQHARKIAMDRFGQLKKVLPLLVLGQIISIAITGTGGFSQAASNSGADTSMAQVIDPVWIENFSCFFFCCFVERHRSLDLMNCMVCRCC
jgi:hypothetical protein